MPRMNVTWFCCNGSNRRAQYQAYVRSNGSTMILEPNTEGDVTQTVDYSSSREFFWSDEGEFASEKLKNQSRCIDSSVG
jgi:hypothetical protein